MAVIDGGTYGALADVDNLTKALRSFTPQRRTSGVLNAVNAELVLDINGEASATIFINGTGTFNATYNVQGSPDGTTYFDLLSYPIPQGCLGGTIPQAGQPIISEAVNAATIQRLIAVGVGGMQKIRVRLSAYTSGTSTVTINADIANSISPYVRDQKAATLIVTATAAAAAAATATIPAVAGMRHYIDRIDVTKFASALLVAAAAPVLVTTTNIPGSPVFTFPADAAAQGTAVQQNLDFSASGMAATALNTATTVVCPATTSIIWRVTVAYRLGL